MTRILRILITSGDMSGPSLMVAGWIAFGALITRMAGVW